MTFEDFLNDHAVESVDADYSAYEMSRCWNTALSMAIKKCQMLRKDSVATGYNEGWDDALDIVEKDIWDLRDE